MELNGISGSAAQTPKANTSTAAKPNNKWFWNNDVDKHKFEYEGDEPLEMTPLHVYAIFPKRDLPPSVKQEDKRAGYDADTLLMLASFLGGYRNDVQAGRVKRPIRCDKKPTFVLPPPPKNPSKIRVCTLFWI